MLNLLILRKTKLFANGATPLEWIKVINDRDISPDHLLMDIPG
ncbi:MAG: hypothetical protein CM15mP54_15560 [Paracoccaceae bacterium]|nr:MAG: hypothetical protein CM15mP54_15560 [Paracoccaceae bacterium]